MEHKRYGVCCPHCQRPFEVEIIPGIAIHTWGGGGGGGGSSKNFGTGGSGGSGQTIPVQGVGGGPKTAAKKIGWWARLKKWLTEPEWDTHRD